MRGHTLRATDTGQIDGELPALDLEASAYLLSGQLEEIALTGALRIGQAALPGQDRTSRMARRLGAS